MSPFYFVDVEMYSDREEDLQALYAELAEEDTGQTTGTAPYHSGRAARTMTSGERRRERPLLPTDSR